jgi:hypothetical protein
MVTATVLAPNPLGDVLGDDDRLGRQFDLLQGSVAVLRRNDSVRRIDRADLEPISDALIDLLGRKRDVLVFGMAFLAANGPLGSLLSLGLLSRGLDQIAGGWLGGVAGVFLSGRPGLSQLGVLGLGFLQAPLQPGVAFFELTVFGFQFPAASLGLAAALDPAPEVHHSSTEKLSKIRAQRIKPNALGRQGAPLETVIATAPTAHAHTLPISSRVTGSCKAVGLDERFGQRQILPIDETRRSQRQNRTIPVTVHRLVIVKQRKES